MGGYRDPVRPVARARTVVTRAEPPDDPEKERSRMRREMAKAAIQQIAIDERERRQNENHAALVGLVVALLRGWLG